VRQIMQQLRSAEPELVETVPQRIRPRHLMVRTEASIVSAGTERMLVEFAGASLLGKARQQPDRLRQLSDKVRTDGLLTTFDAVRTRLGEPLALGYANAGRVIAVGDGVSGFFVGDRVATNGPHAEVVVVPQTMSARVPDGVSSEEAAFATIGAVALEGVRLSEPSLGETYVVTGLGLVGLLAAQLLRANGCTVLGVDTREERRALARTLGIDAVPADGSVIEAALESSRGRGVDGVLLTLSTTSNDPVHDAATMCRRRGRIVLVGVTGLDLQRADFYEKELAFRVSCAYGPGRYDATYEDDAIDYPFGEVRWTAGRNMQSVVDMISSGRLDAAALITHRFDFDDAVSAYAALTSDPSALGIALRYSPASVEEAVSATSSVVRPTGTARSRSATSARLGIIGSGSYTNNTLLPALRSIGADVRVLVGGGGGAATTAERFGIDQLVNSPDELIADDGIDAVLVMTRHDSHATLVAAALDAGKDVFVEKPLAIDRGGLDLVEAAYERRLRDGATPVVGIGFNRRFAPITERMVTLLRGIPLAKFVSINVNAGAVHRDHWTQAPSIGGGRIIGEACHFIDLARWLAGTPITEVSSVGLGVAGPQDSVAITLRHLDGSVSSINYVANGARRFPKELITVFAGGRVLVNHNFRSLRSYGFDRVHPVRSLRQEKGHSQGLQAFLAAIRGETTYSIPFDELSEVTSATFAAAHLDE
jgi:predicted dehydrogenase/NADPH:quinone reductase-like Zn-dependent oxidoreductase